MKCIKILNYMLTFVFIILTILLWPVFYILRYKKNKVRYITDVYWKWIKQRPHFMAFALANNNYNVVYSNIIINGTNYPDYKVVENDNKNILLKDIYINTNSNHFKNLKRNVLSFFMNYDVIIITHPLLIPHFNLFLIKLKGTKIIYDCMDFYEYYIPENMFSYYKLHEKQLVLNSDLITASSEKLLGDLLIYKPKKTMLIRNGYDASTFNEYNSKRFNFKKKNAVYIGCIDWYFDFDIIYQYAKKRKDFNFYIIGPVIGDAKDIINNNKYANIHFLGPVEHERVPQAIKEADVLILPFKIEKIIERVDPIKLYEYLYFNKKIICSYWDELERFKDVVLFYNNYQSFEKLLDNYKDYNIDKKKIKHIIKESSWDNRLNPLIEGLKNKKL